MKLHFSLTCPKHPCLDSHGVPSNKISTEDDEEVPPNDMQLMLASSLMLQHGLATSLTKACEYLAPLATQGHHNALAKSIVDASSR